MLLSKDENYKMHLACILLLKAATEQRVSETVWLVWLPRVLEILNSWSQNLKWPPKVPNIWKYTFCKFPQVLKIPKFQETIMAARPLCSYRPTVFIKLLRIPKKTKYQLTLHLVSCCFYPKWFTISVPQVQVQVYLSHIIILGIIIVKCVSVSSFNCPIKISVK